MKKRIKKFNEYINEGHGDLNFDIEPNVTLREIEEHGKWINDYELEKDGLQKAGFVNIYQYKGYKWFIISYEFDEKELLKNLTEKL